MLFRGENPTRFAVAALALAAFCLPGPARACYWNAKLDKWVGACSDSGNSGQKAKATVPKSPPGKVGPLSDTATTSFSESGLAVTSQEQNTSTALQGLQQQTFCNGSTCNTTPQVVSNALSGATQVSGSAQQRISDALARRDQILGSVEAGAQGGRYPMQDVQKFQTLFQDSRTPDNDQIQKLNPSLHDAAHALRTNNQELDYLGQVKDKYDHVAQDAREMQRKLDGISDRSRSLGAKAASAKAGTAAYPLKLSSADRAQEPGNGQSRPGSARENDLGAAPGRGISNDLPSAVAGEGSASKAGGTAGNQAGAATALSPVGASGEPAKGQLSEEGKKMLAGMLSELKADIANGQASGNALAVPEGAGSGVEELAKAEGRSQSLIGGAILDISQAASGEHGRLPASVKGYSKNQGHQPSDMDFFGIDKDLFKRVNECIRRSSVAGK